MDRLISEKEVLDAIADHIRSESNIAKLIVDIQAIPSAEPKTGHWKSFTHSAYHGIDDDGEPIWREVKVYHCDLCNRRTVIKESYCPNCGAKMVEPQERSDKE